MRLRGTLTAAMAVAAITTTVLVGLTPAGARPAALTGTGHGTWTLTPSPPDTGSRQVVTGRGHFSVGDAAIRGRVLTPGFIASGYCSVRLRLTTSHGALTVTGHSRRTSPPPSCDGPVRFRFTTRRGTGDLAGASYLGVGRIDLQTASSGSVDRGTFTLALSRLSS